MNIPSSLLPIVIGLGSVLCLGIFAGIILRLIPKTKKTGQDVLSRTIAWWFMVIIVLGSCLSGDTAICILFACISFQGLREYFAVTRVRKADQRALFWSMFVVLPIQYILVSVGWYGMFAIFIPVYAFVCLAIFTTLRGDANDFLARSAKIFFGVMIVVYFVSHIAMLPTLDLFDPDDNPFPHVHGEFVLFLLIVSQGNDVCQYIWGKSFGKHKIAPTLSPNKTWQGFIGGVISSAGLAMLLSYLIPLALWQCALLGIAIACLGFAGDIIMSSIKRDAGIKDYGNLLGGHGGVLDRIDGLAIAAPVYFHILRYYAGGPF